MIIQHNIRDILKYRGDIPFVSFKNITYHCSLFLCLNDSRESDLYFFKRAQKPAQIY